MQTLHTFKSAWPNRGHQTTRRVHTRMLRLRRPQSKGTDHNAHSYASGPWLGGAERGGCSLLVCQGNSTRLSVKCRRLTESKKKSNVSFCKDSPVSSRPLDHFG